MNSAAVVLYMTSSWLLLTSCDGSTVTKFKALYGAVPMAIISQEKTIRARSQVECAIRCRRDPSCVSFAYIRAPSSSCYLHPVTLTTSADVRSSNTTGKMAAVYLQSDQGCRYIPYNDSFASVTIRHSLDHSETNVTCKDDYHPPVLHAVCEAGGQWSDLRCLKRLWTYPETVMPSSGRVTIQVPGTVTTGWSACVQGIPTANDRVIIEILDNPESNTPVHTSWRLATNYTAINDLINGSWGTEKAVHRFSLNIGRPFDFRLTLNTSNTAHIYMDRQLFGNWTLRVPLSSFAKISIGGTVNVTRVETWCRY